MKRTSLITALVLLCASPLLHAAAKPDVKPDLFNETRSATLEDVKATPQTAPEPVLDSSAKTGKDWTIMVFMNGKSNIEPFALGDMNRFETIGSGEKVNIVTELGRSKGLDNDTAADGDWAGVRRYLVVKDADKEHIASPVLMDLGGVDMGDYREVVSFVKWARAAYPAKRYMLVIWDHGWGWLDPKKPGENLVEDRKSRSAGPRAAKSISHDFVTGNYIKTVDMGKIFKEAGRVDLYTSMACFMQMAEVAYELKDAAEIIVGSEEVIQLPSLNFEDFFALMLAKPGSTPAQAGVYLVDTFKEMYSRPEHSDMLEKTKYGVQLSAIRSDKLPVFAAKVRNWARLAMQVNDTAAYSKARTGVLRFEVGDETTDPDKQISFYGDLYHFVELINSDLSPSLPGAGAFKAAGEDLNNFIAAELTVKNAYLGKDRTGKDYSNTHGIAINIPGKPGTLLEYYPTYSRLAFEKATGWQGFMNYLEKIERP